MTLPVHRKGALLHVRFTGSTAYDGDAVTKITTDSVAFLGQMFPVICAWLLALRRSASREARLLVLALLAMTACSVLSPTSVTFTNGAVSCMLFIVGAIAFAGTALLPVFLARAFSRASAWRTIAEAAAVLAALAMLAGSCMTAIGIVTASLDPMPFVWDTFWRWLQTGLSAVAFVIVSHAVATAGRDVRPRAAWLLLPIPAGMLVSSIFGNLQGAAPSWQIYMGLGFIANVVALAAAAAVTYALMRRRLLDFQFVVARTLVVGVISLMSSSHSCSWNGCWELLSRM